MKPDLVNCGRKYLLSFDGVTDQMIELHLKEWQDRKRKNLSGIYQSFLNHAKNRQSMPNTIGDIAILRDVLYKFNPKKVAEQYSSHTCLLQEMKKQKIQTPSKIVVKNPKSHWVIFTKSVISSAKFMRRFRNAKEFHDFVDSFDTNEYSRLALPLLLKEEIFGFGFALSCDFLKESGYSQFIKPDTHLNEICRGVGITSATTDFGVFKDVIAFCLQQGLIPYEFDKLIWLIGSGKFYKSGLKVATKKADFIKMFNTGRY